MIKNSTPYDTHTEDLVQERNRMEERIVSVYKKGVHNLGDVWNDHIQTIIKVERSRKVFNTKTKKFDETMSTTDDGKDTSVSIYISTKKDISAQDCAAHIRGHWGIENSNHYVRDVVFKEDASRMRKNPEHVATLRSFAMNLMRVNKEKNMNMAVYRNALNIKRVLGYVGVGC